MSASASDMKSVAVKKADEVPLDVKIERVVNKWEKKKISEWRYNDVGFYGRLLSRLNSGSSSLEKKIDKIFLTLEHAEVFPDFILLQRMLEVFGSLGQIDLSQRFCELCIDIQPDNPVPAAKLLQVMKNKLDKYRYEEFKLIYRRFIEKKLISADLFNYALDAAKINKDLAFLQEIFANAKQNGLADVGLYQRIIVIAGSLAAKDLMKELYEAAKQNSMIGSDLIVKLRVICVNNQWDDLLAGLEKDNLNLYKTLYESADLITSDSSDSKRALSLKKKRVIAPIQRPAISYGAKDENVKPAASGVKATAATAAGLFPPPLMARSKSDLNRPPIPTVPVSETPEASRSPSPIS